MSPEIRVSVYQVTNTANGKRYVGITRFPLGRRWTQHRYRAANSPRTEFHRAIAKYGASAFKVDHLATCLSATEAWAVEREVIADRRPEYNQTNGGEFTVGKRVPRETVDRIRAANTGKRRTPEQNARMSEIKRAMYAERPDLLALTAERICVARKSIDRDKQRAAVSAWGKARVYTQEQKAAMAARLIPAKRKMVECVTLATVFDSVTEAAEFTDMSVCAVSNVCCGRHPSAHGLVFRFA